MYLLPVFLVILGFVHSQMMGGGTPINETCVLMPYNMSCMNYQLPTSVVNMNIDDLCSEMPFMCGCTIDNLCSNADISSSPYCGRFSILKDLCVDMPGMSGCANYRSMCMPNSTVMECDTSIVPNPKTMETWSMISSICNEMPMDGCSECVNNQDTCDYLSTYSSLCKAMPDMSQCGAWKTMCAAIPDWPLCASNNSADPPIMRMYFHTGIVDYVLFYGWVPRTAGEYVGTWFAVFVAGILLDGIRLIRAVSERKWKTMVKKTKDGSPLYDIRIDLPRAFLRFIEVSWGYLLMLVAMTFNVGLFFAVCVGIATGTLIFGRYLEYDPSKESCCA